MESYDLFQKVMQCKDMLASISNPNKKALEAELDSIASRYLNIPNSFEVCDDLKEEINRLEIIINRYTSPPDKLDKFAFLKDSIRKQVYFLSKLPTPYPELFNKDIFNIFMTTTRNTILQKLDDDNTTYMHLINLSRDLSHEHLLFIDPEFKDIYMDYWDFFNNALHHNFIYTKEQESLLNIVKSRLKRLDISIRELYFLKEVFEEDKRYQVINSTELNLLSYFKNDPSMYSRIGKILGIRNEVLDELQASLLFKESLLPSREHISPTVICNKGLEPNVF